MISDVEWQSLYDVAETFGVRGSSAAREMDTLLQRQTSDDAIFATPVFTARFFRVIASDSPAAATNIFQSHSQ